MTIAIRGHQILEEPWVEPYPCGWLYLRVTPNELVGKCLPTLAFTSVIGSIGSHQQNVVRWGFIDVHWCSLIMLGRWGPLHLILRHTSMSPKESTIEKTGDGHLGAPGSDNHCNPKIFPGSIIQSAWPDTRYSHSLCIFFHINIFLHHTIHDNMWCHTVYISTPGWL